MQAVCVLNRKGRARLLAFANLAGSLAVGDAITVLPPVEASSR